MARQHKIGQFVPIYQGDYWLRRLKIANEEHTWPTRYNAYYLMLRDNNVTKFTVKHSSYINAATGYLIE